MAEIRRPNIVSPTTEGQIKEITAYLHQMVDELNFLIRPNKTENKASAETAGLPPEQIFESIKEMIYTSREIVSILTREVSKSIGGKYASAGELSKHLSEADTKFEEIQAAIDNIEAQNVTVDSELNEESDNPIANKAVVAALSKKAESIHSHTTSDVQCDNSGYWWGESSSVEDAFMKISDSFASESTHIHGADDIGFSYEGMSFNTVADALIYLLNHQNTEGGTE